LRAVADFNYFYVTGIF